MYHITSRGNEQKAIFKDNQDRRWFLDILYEVNKRYNWICHAYCLMTNHYHLIIETPDGNLSRGMHQLNGVYTQIFNRRYHRAGHLFQGRYKAILVQKETYLLEVCRYVVLNPVRAEVVKYPKGWQWSSYRASAGFEMPHRCLTPNRTLNLFASNRIKAQRQYRQFVREGIGLDSLWEKVKGQCVLGDDNYIKKFTSYIKDKQEIVEIPRQQRFVGRPSLSQLFSLSGLTDKEQRNQKVLEAIDKFGYSQKQVANFLSIHYSTISKLIKEIKEISKFKT